MGVPISADEAEPDLEFFASTLDDDTGLSNEIYTAINTDEITISNALSVSDYDTGVTCSFAGGCSYTITADGLSNSIEALPETNYITVCGIECPYDEDSSTDAIMACSLPPLSTIYSDTYYTISEETNDLQGEYFGSASDNSVAFDDDLTVDFASDTAECYLGMAFAESHIGYLSGVRWFIVEIDDKSVFSGITTFQGSDDDSTYTDLFTLDGNVHEGWNYYSWDDDSYPTYQYYRFYSTSAAGCAFSEVKFTGVETIDDDSDTYTCDVAIYVDDTL